MSDYCIVRTSSIPSSQHRYYTSVAASSRLMFSHDIYSPAGHQHMSEHNIQWEETKYRGEKRLRYLCIKIHVFYGA